MTGNGSCLNLLKKFEKSYQVNLYFRRVLDIWNHCALFYYKLVGQRHDPHCQFSFDTPSIPLCMFDLEVLLLRITMGVLCRDVGRSENLWGGEEALCVQMDFRRTFETTTKCNNIP